MVQTAESSYTYEVPFEFVVLAHNQRYPSPYGTHILSSDVISRELSLDTMTLTTTRLMNKRGKMPKWAPAFISSIGTSWVLETSHVRIDGDPDHTTLTTESRNLDHTKIMRVEEVQQFRPSRTDPLSTESVTHSRITSDLDFWLLRDRVEKFGIAKLPSSITKARLGLELVSNVLLQPSTCREFLNSGPLRPFAFGPVPSPLSLAFRQKLDEARQVWLSNQQQEQAQLGNLATDSNSPLLWRGSLTPGQPDEDLKWRVRWKRVFERGKQRFKDRVCTLTGLLCEPSDPPARGNPDQSAGETP
ncbi:uncharacterized protein JCM15063_005753 [Sporobolomyces koalae]|uniref:uncharacterized protein n=1 Tax=Sporobolomyces koalae TaxID=500713 RepID=UPI00316D489C